MGQAVKEGDIILEVETDKAAVEIPSPYTGTVLEILVKPGDTVKVGQVLMTFVRARGKTGGSPATVPQPAARTGSLPEPRGRRRPGRRPARKGPVPASPATRRLARELGVDLAQVPRPAAPPGLVTADGRARVRRSAARRWKPRRRRAVPHPTAEGPGPRRPLRGAARFRQWGPVERVPFRSIRRATARQMSLAWSQIPHVNSQDYVDVTRLEVFRRKHKTEIEALGGRLTFTVFALKAVTTALKAHPRVNASLDTAAGEIVLKKYYPHRCGGEHRRGARRARGARRRQQEHQGARRRAPRSSCKGPMHARSAWRSSRAGRFTITNAGALGGWTFAPIINHPQVAILGLGQGRACSRPSSGGKKAWWSPPRLIMPAVLCIDHRVLDGADAVNFLKLFKQIMEDPDELLMSIA